MTQEQALPICVAGDWRLGRGARYASHYPATNEVVAWLNAADLQDVEEAVQGAHQAFLHSGWAQRKPHERAAVLLRIAGLIRERGEELAQLQRQDNGKPINETRALVASAAATFQFFAAACETLEETITPSRGDFVSMSVYEPMGVIAAITPWNSPIASEAQKLAPALAAGNAVVIKPAEITPLLALQLARICDDAGLPKGLVSVLPGKGSLLGDALTRHPLVKKVSFTGGTRTGKHIAHIAADKMMPVSLELGGKSPTIVLDDADLDHAVAGVLYGIFSSSGEACIAGSRLFVTQRLYQPFMDRLVDAASRLRVGDPAHERTQMGPLISAEHRQSVERYVALGLAAGGCLRLGGERLAGAAYERGFYYPPTILEGLHNQQQVCQEEIFGPVLVAMPFDDEADALRMANDSPYGLGASIWSNDLAAVHRMIPRIRSGSVWVNCHSALDPALPFGGYKMSGVGREMGHAAIEHYTELKSVLIKL